MSVNAWSFADMIQRIAAPIVQSIAMAPEGGLLISTDRRDSFLGLAMQCCAAGAADRVQVLHTREGTAGLALSTADGLAIGPLQAALAGRGSMRARQAASLDHHAMQGRRVFAVALDSDAVAACAWRGASSLIARDRPVFVAYAQGKRDVLGELAAHDYHVQDILCWTYPQASAVMALAIPREQLGAASHGMAPAIAMPVTRADTLLSADDGYPALKTMYQAHELDVETGFYPPDTGEDGAAWIWSGPEKAGRIRLPTPWFGRGRLTVHFAHSAEAVVDLSAIELRINNRAMPKTVGAASLTIPLSISIGDFSGMHRLSIVSQEMIACPYGSNRWLGCCVQAVELEWF